MTDDFINEEDTLDPNAKYFEQLVGDGKKFKTPEDLAKGKHESDVYINTLTKRMDELRNDYAQLRQDYNSRAKLEEVLDQMKTGQSTQPLANDAVDSKPQLQSDDIAKMIASEIQRNKQADIEETNFKQVQTKLKERFGNNKDVLNQHLQELGLSEDFAKELARKHPAVFMKTLGLDQQANQQDDFMPPPRSNVRRDSFAPKTQKRTWQYYQDLKKSDPSLYASKQMTVQMHKDYEELGQAFEDGDFHSARYS